MGHARGEPADEPQFFSCRYKDLAAGHITETPPD